MPRLALLLFVFALGSMAAAPIRYGVIGDSYSCGEGATPAEEWPEILAQKLTASGLPTTVVVNPARTGWTTRQALDAELPVFLAAHPDFATVQIGVNDFVQGVPPAEFRRRFTTLLDRMLAALPPNRLLVVTIPDFSVTPAAAGFGEAAEIARGLEVFNTIIKEEAATRHLSVVDVFRLSQAMGRDSALRAADGLHPSAREYALWAEAIEPAARGLLAADRD